MEKHIIENEIDKGEQENIGTGLDDFEILQTLGKGSYGFVSKVKSKKNQKIYALKMIDLALVNDQQEVDLLMNEIKIIQSLDSPHIVKFHYYFYIGKKIYILMEYINNGDIKGYIQANMNMQKTIPEQEIWELMYQCMSGLCYIHKNNLIHRDIKPANLFLTDDKTVKIGDFGVSAERKVGNTLHRMQKETLMIGTPLYMSPEIFAHQEYGSKVDIYSLGCTFHELCYFSAPRLPLPGVNQNGEIFTDLKDIPPKYNINSYSNELKNIINLMIEKDQHKRYDSAKIFEIIKLKYNSFKVQSTSIFCVYRSLLCFPIIIKKCQKHTPPQDPQQLKQYYITHPITCSFDLAMKNMLIPNPNSPSYPVIHQLRDILTFNDSTLIDPGEIDCIDLIKYIIKKFFLETNHNPKCVTPNLYSQEDDLDTFNRENMIKKYLSNFNDCFKSFISHYFFGTFETNRTCTQCKQNRTFFENYYYLTINVNTAMKYNLNSNDQNFILHCLQQKHKINVRKFCPNCNNITIQEELKEILNLPINIIIYIKYDDENNINNVCYPITLNLADKTPNSNYLFYLKAVIQQNINNGQKNYGCSFAYNQNWYFLNGYNIFNCQDSPLKFTYGKPVMLFYSTQNQ